MKNAKSFLFALTLLLGAGLLLAGCGDGSDAASGATGDGADSAAAASADAPKSGLAAYDTDGDGVVYQGGMHPDIIQDEPGQCPICGMDLSPVRVDGAGGEGGVKIQPVTLQNMGVRTAPVEVAALQRQVRTTGRFEASEQRMTAISPKVGGWVERLYVDYEGDRVQRGQPLLEIYSPELVATQEEYLLALRNAERLGGGEDAGRLVDAARRRLAYWDISDVQIDRLKETGEPTKTLTLHAPARGTVTRKNVTEGARIQAGQTLLHLTDLSRLWLMLDVYEQDLAWVEVGSPVEVELPYAPGQAVQGRVDYLYDELESDTRTVKARVTVPNPGGKLRPGMYATARITGQETRLLPVVPAEAVVSSGAREAVVLALGDGRFRPVNVQTGIQSDGQVQILSGLSGGEEVVTSAQFLIDSEARLQSALGAMDAGPGADSTRGGNAPGMEGMDMQGMDMESDMDMSGASGRASAAEAQPAEAQTAEAQTAAMQPAAMQDSVQVARITIGPEGFAPQQIELEAGRPARLVFTRQTEQTCATEVQIPAFGIEKTPLPMNEPVAIELTPGESGSFTFACGMDMLKGTLVVVQS